MNKADSHIKSRQLGPLRYSERPAKTGLNAPTIVFLHGNSFSSAVFQKQFNSAQLNDFRLIAFDLPGHGQSKPITPDTDYSFGTLADVIIDGLDALDLRNVVVAGWSLGGHVALEMQDRTTRIAGTMIFGAPPLLAGALSSIRAYHFSRDMFLVSKSLLSPVDAVRFERFCIGREANGEHIKAIKAADPKMRVNVFKSVLHGRNRDQHDLAINAVKPLCILHGADDPLIRTSYIESIADNPSFSGEIATIDDAGHAPFIDQPAVFDFMVASFTRRIAAGNKFAKPTRKQAA